MPHTAKALGLPDTVEVILGGQDQKLAAIGAGIAEDICTVSIGTATAITKLNPAAETGCPLFAFDDGRVFAETSISTTGAAIDWLSRVLGVRYEEMDVLAEQSPKGARGVRFDIGLSAEGGIRGLSLAAEKGDIIRALYKGIAEETAKKIRQMGGAKEVRVFGGGSKSDVLNRILAGTVGAGVCVTDTAETAALGAAMLASGGKIKCAKIRKRFV